MKMKNEYETENAYVYALTQALYREYCDCIGRFGVTSETANMLYEMLLECIRYCDKHNVDYNLNYDYD